MFTAVQLWFRGQGRADPLTTHFSAIVTDKHEQWQQIDASLCTVLWFSIAPNLQHSYQAFDTCYDVWHKAKKVYVNNVQRLYNVITTMMTTKLENRDIQTYLSKLGRLIADYNNLMPYPSDVASFEKQRNQFFMILALAGLPPELESVRNQILSAPIIPTYDIVNEQLLRLSISHIVATPSATAANSSALVSHSSNRGSARNDGRGKQNRRCNYSTSLVILKSTVAKRLENNVTISASDYQDLLQLRAAQQSASPATTVAHSGNPVAFMSQSPSLGPWILDSGASDHMTGNQSYFSKLSFSDSLPPVTLADGSQIKDRHTGQTIGAGHESGGLYRLSSLIACVSTSADLAHQRLGHPSLEKLRLLVPSLSTVKNIQCESCQLGKHVCYSYFVTFIDDFSRCTWVFLMKHRSDVFHIFQSFFSEIASQFGQSIKILRTDNAKEYLSSKFQSFLSSQGILHQTSCAHTPQQNGVAERKNRHLVETARTILLHHKVPLRFWGDAILTACYLINRMPSSVLSNQIPYTILYPQKDLYPVPLHVFGCTCFVQDFTPGKDKFSAKSLKCIFLGYSRLQKGYRCFCPQLQRYIDVSFFKSSSPFFSEDITSHTSLDDQPTIPTPALAVVTDPPPLLVYQRTTRHPQVVPSTTPPASFSAPTDSLAMPPALEHPLPELPIAIHKGIRTTRNPHPLYACTLSCHRLSPSYFSFVSSLDSVSIPKSTGEAMVDSRWRQAMLDEMDALQTSGTWELLPLPPDKSTIGCRWVYTVKVAPYGSIDRFKARLVAKGYTQIYGLDYGDTFSPVAKMTSVRLFLAMAAIRHWPLHQLDIKNAFLNGELQEEVYMNQPPGFIASGETHLVCRLRRSLYGLKQSPRAWFGRFSSALIEFGMTRCEADHSVFFLHSSSRICIYLVVYVDDIIITGDDSDGICRLKVTSDVTSYVMK
uniref:Retrovirus-related Pol polyprotein from transposon TNT 1-94 n=1 Tax=Cajanus cajan TaxID=3821 RepID=A0A151RSB9_CAJCA|nr:Retrovirus-related Pol polyprotein from transposon TNT 1-94 [Cajanus cajan]